MLTPDAARALAEAGPWAVVILLGGLAGITLIRGILTLWRVHLAADQHDRDQLTRALALLELAEQGNAVAAEAGKAMAAAWTERNRIDADRLRLEASRRRRLDKP